MCKVATEHYYRDVMLDGYWRETNDPNSGTVFEENIEVGKFIQLLTTFVGGFIVGFIKGWLLSLVLISCIPVLLISGGATGLVMCKLSSRAQVAYAQAGNVVEQTVAAFNGEKLAINKYDNILKLAYAFTVQQGFVSGVGLGTFLLILLSTYGLTIWYGSKLIIEKGYHGGDVINVLMAIVMGGISLGQATPSLNAFAAGQAAAYKMFETINRKPLIDSSDTSGIVLEDIKGEVELKDVYFSYPARQDVQIFSGFSLVVPSGKTVALVGQSGSGKSTIISLLERFYDPEVGEVLIDGVNLKKYQLKWLRQQMGLVSQEPILFATTIKENISYGKENATEEEINAAIELANAANFISKLPQGLDTTVGEHGTQLSGGQKQRLAIARAILKNPKILLLDEATSALDAESERIVQEALEKVMTVALVGESGSGKSTVISLIERFYNPESGEIHLDGVGIKQFKLRWLRQQMGLVSQEPVLFNERIRDNIAYSRQGKATEEEIIQAAKSTNAHNFISSLPQGYDKSVGERGIQLSGGQKQRIAIARAILKDPKILLLDEATSALDAESEHTVQEALDRVMVNRTTVVVAHRLTTIKGADVIAVVKNGVIAEKGRHVLMNIEDGVYASLVALSMTSA
ncbi:ABC transporter B family member 11 [Capsicum annuum]|nr:ABC transporter B family member 11 [Capsicum annuum]